MRRIQHVAVVVPARDEAETIDSTMDSIDHARRGLPAGVTSSCTIVLDASIDETYTVIERRVKHATRSRRELTPPQVVRSSQGCVGAARSLGCRVAMAGTPHASRHIWLANTDADTTVPSHWLAAQLELAERSVGAVAGTVELGDDVDASLRARFTATYELSGDGTHRHVHGANLGVRGDIYRLAGGWRPLHTGEDHDLWGRLGRVTTGVSSTAITVRTSARTRGRAPAGFASDIVRLMSDVSPSDSAIEEPTVA